MAELIIFNARHHISVSAQRNIKYTERRSERENVHVCDCGVGERELGNVRDRDRERGRERERERLI